MTHCQSMEPRLLLVSAVTLALLPACQFGPAIERVIEDPSRLCPSGQQLVVDEAGGVKCVPRPEPVEPTATPTQQPTRTPACCDPTPTPVITATVTPTPTVAPTPTPAPQKPELCATGAPDYTLALTTDPLWRLPGVAIPVRKSGPCPPFTIEVGPDRNDQPGCVVTWTKRAGEKGRTPAEGAQVSLANGHVVIDTDGMVRDTDNQKHCGGDAYGRRVCDGQLAGRPDGRTDMAEWDGNAAHPIPCPVSTPPPTPTPIGPTPKPAGCEVVEGQEHWMAPGQSCHAWKWDGTQIRCLVDSTIRPICDPPHRENWVSICGHRDHDPDYSKPENAFSWRIVGAIDLGPNPDNAAQRYIIGSPGDWVSVEVCIPLHARTPDGCVITARNGGCGKREFVLPGGSE